MTNREYMHSLSDIELIKWVQSKPWGEYTYYGFGKGLELKMSIFLNG